MHDVKIERTPRHFDRYTGTAQALIAAGVVMADQLPGAPGRGKTLVTIRADGGRPHTKSPEYEGSNLYVPGHKVIRKVRDDRFVVEITVPADELARRRAERNRQWDEAVKRAERAKLRDRGQISLVRPLGRPALRLVWSGGHHV